MAAPLIVASALAAAAAVPALGLDAAGGFAFAGAMLAATQKLPRFKNNQIGWAMVKSGSGGNERRRNPGGGRRYEDTELRMMAQDAKTLAEKAMAGIEKHEAVCSERFLHIKESLDESKGFQQWAMRGGVAAMLALLGDILLHLLKIGG